VGLKPTWGRVSRWGVVAFASSLDQVGPLGRSVADSALALAVMAGPDGRDATSVHCPGVEDLARLDPPTDLDGWRVGVIRELDVEDPGRVWEEGRTEAATEEDSWRDSWEGALERLRELGARVVKVSVPDAPAALAAYQVVASSEASANLARFDGVRYGSRQGAESLESLYVESRSRGFGAEVKRRILLGTFALAEGYREAYYHRAQGVRNALRRQLAAVFEEVDVVVTPTTPGAAFRLGERVDRPLAMYRSDRFTTLAGLTGVPAVAVPSELDEEGLPRSLQILGRAWDERRILAAAGAFERAVGFRCAPAFASVPSSTASTTGPTAGPGEASRARG
jgi:aspartyl-tRNA(Asn)/glutamyl-tRNA(Gln) amidotransferase subunit A